MNTEDMWENYNISDERRLKCLDDGINEILSIVLKNVEVGIGLFEMGNVIRALYLNETYLKYFGSSENKIEEWKACILEHMPQNENIHYTTRGYRTDGTLGWFEVKAVPIADKIHAVPLYLIIASDISNKKDNEIKVEELKEANSQLLFQEERYKILEATAQGLLFEYYPDKDTMIFSYNFPNNKKRKEIPNYNEYQKKFPLVHSSHRDIFKKALAEACTREVEDSLEYLSSVSGGGYRWHITHYKSLAGPDGKIASVIGRIEDIHDTKMKQEMLNYKADMDGLTNLYRKETAFEKMQEYVKEAPTSEFYFVILDLDDFKQINDQYGHQYGDNILKKTSEELTRLFNETSIIGRFGGDEFIILTKNLPYDEVKRLLECLKINIRFCAGIVSWNSGDDIKDVFDKADKAMYQVKATDKNGIYFLK